MLATDFSRAPSDMRYSRKSDFEPKFVSIGPNYYNKRKTFIRMEKVKTEFTSYFLRRLPSDKTDPSIDDLVSELKVFELEDQIRKWYGERIKLRANDLFRMLVRDSCFIIRIIISLSREETESMYFPSLDIKKLRFDLLLLENQIPYFFLKRVYDFLWERHVLLNESPPSTMSSLPRRLKRKDLDQSQTNSLPRTPSSSSTSSVCLDQFLRELNPFICLDMPWEFDKHRMQINEPDHLLDLYWKWCLPSDLDPDTYLHNHRDNTFDIDRHKSWVKIHLRSNADKRIPNACELYQRVGIKFEKRKHQKGFGVEFHNGIMQLPHLKLDQNQTTLLVNLIAFEDFKPSKDRVLTSYILLLDGLINTKRDVELLQQHGIIHNKLSNIESASTFFNDIGNICSVDYEDHYCRGRFKDLNNYYKSSWNRQFPKLWHTSFSSPWAVISLLVGALLLILAALQTGYTIASYYKQK